MNQFNHLQGSNQSQRPTRERESLLQRSQRSPDQEAAERHDQDGRESNPAGAVFAPVESKEPKPGRPRRGVGPKGAIDCKASLLPNAIAVELTEDWEDEGRCCLQHHPAPYGVSQTTPLHSLKGPCSFMTEEEYLFLLDEETLPTIGSLMKPKTIEEAFTKNRRI